MSKFIKSTLCIVSICVLFLGGCSNGMTKKEGQTNKEEILVTSSEEIENGIDDQDKNQSANPSGEIENGVDSSNDNNIYSSKQIYLEKLNELEANLDISLKEKYSGTTLEMVEAGSEEYEQWDNILNEIYSELKQQLSEEDMKKLTEEELTWIKSRDEKGEAAANEFKGGTMENLNRLMSLMTSTKERCYELVNKYMK